MNGIISCFQRYEKKYLLTKEQYYAIRIGMSHYMRPDEYPHYSIRNIYYDTKNYDLIRASMEKPAYKEKLRMRSYGIPGTNDNVFIEIKKKFDGVVYKRRITMKLIEAAGYLDGMQNGNGSQIGREIDYFLQLYRPEPKVFISYQREAYRAADGSELRITFDTALRARSNNLTLLSGDHGAALLPSNQCLMEIKIPGAAPLWLSRLLSENGIFPITFSKYGAYYKQIVQNSRNDTARETEVVLSA